MDLNSNKLEDDGDIISNKSVNEQYEFYERQGMNKKEIIKQIAKNKKVSKNEIYQIFLDK